MRIYYLFIFSLSIPINRQDKTCKTIVIILRQTWSNMHRWAGQNNSASATLILLSLFIAKLINACHNPHNAISW